MGQGVVRQGAPQPTTLVRGVHDDVPQGRPVDEIRDDPAEPHEFVVVPGREAEARPVDHGLDPLDGAAVSPLRVTIKEICRYRF